MQEGWGGSCWGVGGNLKFRLGVHSKVGKEDKGRLHQTLNCRIWGIWILFPRNREPLQAFAKRCERECQFREMSAGRSQARWAGGMR